MARDEPKFTFRMPADVKKKLKDRAIANGRSFNAELLQIVQDALDKPSTTPNDNAMAIAEEQSELVKKMVYETLSSLYRSNAKDK
ncbi:Arc family DNA-binding protein [Klebsiella sp. P1CD1]|uniref:Arc family DNA-binding protein n=1 Tax=Klebsiella sp. P1CD1 TaxID=2267618 RepID=UPI000F4E8168|nr:Arc family DNA-binding protein [Klebsiella sp. P1CD1]AYW18597.1 Arc family DNA-binding protein [Klebsiella sp. P1CD1]